MSNKTLAEKIVKGITLTLAITMGSSVATTAYALENIPDANIISVNQETANFSDVISTQWSYESIQWGVQQGLVSGYPDGTYRPANQITEQEFATVLAKYVFKDKNLQNAETGGWSNNYYMELLKYSLPFKGYSEQSLRSKTLSRGQIARIIAAKNGFNLDERQAIYYMYENDISYGVVSGKLSFDSYGKDDAVKREQIPAFFMRLAETGHTKFMGKPSPISDPTQISGVTGQPKDNTVITDEMFNQMEKEKLGTTTPTPVPANPTSGAPAYANEIAAKYGHTVETSSLMPGFTIKSQDKQTVIASFNPQDNNMFHLRAGDYDKYKAEVHEVLKATGKFNDADIKKLENIIYVERMGKTTTFYEVKPGLLVEVTGKPTSNLVIKAAW